MSAKLAAARIATDSGADMVIANGDQIDVIMDIMSGKEKGTLFLAHPNLDFDLMHYLNNEYSDVGVKRYFDPLNRIATCFAFRNPRTPQTPIKWRVHTILFRFRCSACQ